MVRTDFSDDAVWERLRVEVPAPTPDEGFVANVEPVADPDFDGVDEAGLRAAVPGTYPESYDHQVLFVVDAATVAAPDHPLLVVNLHEDPEPSFRTTPRAVQSIENNLSISNMDYVEFAGAVRPDGVFRGF